MNNFYKLLKRDHVQFNLFNSIINVAAVDWFLFASNPTGRCFSHSFDLLSVQHGTYILQMLLRIYTRSLHQNISKYFLKIFSKYLKIFSLRTTWHVHPPHVASHLHSEFAWKYFPLFFYEKKYFKIFQNISSKFFQNI